MEFIPLKNWMPRVVLIFAEEGGFRSGGPFSQPISQLQNEATVLRNGTCVPRGSFATAKHLAKWGFGYENWRFHALGILQLITTKKCYFVDLIIMVLSTFK